MKHYNFWKRGTIGFGGKIQVMTKQICKLHISSKNYVKRHLIVHIEQSEQRKISHKQQPNIDPGIGRVHEIQKEDWDEGFNNE